MAMARWFLLAGLIGWASLANLSGQVELGSEVLARENFKPLLGKRAGLLTNPSGVNHRLESTIELLRRAPGVHLEALFAPEHGLHGEHPAGMEFPNGVDERTGLPIFSLYGPGPTRKPTPEMLKRIDALVYDIQDTGCRSYTFISTMGLSMAACAKAGVEFIVLDRPDPIGGEQVEGPILEPRYRSLIGEWPIPYLYGMTCGELARMINGEEWNGARCRLTVVPMKNWKRSMTWGQTGLHWVPTSPFVPNGDSPLFYPATGLLGWVGGVNIGVKYSLPFQTIAAPWLNGARLAEALGAYHLPGVKFLPITYTPFAPPFQDAAVSGVEIFFSEPARAPKLALNFYALDAIRKISRRDLFAEALRAGHSPAAFDKILGTDSVRRQLAARRSASAIARAWRADEEKFRLRRAKYLLY